MEVFLTLVGLTALLVGGLGVAGAVDGYLRAKRTSIAIMKSLGAGGRLVLGVYLLQVLALASLGVTMGVVAGAAVPPFLAGLLAEILPVELDSTPALGPLVRAGGFGLLTALAFSLPPLLGALAVKPAALFRGMSHRGVMLPLRSRGAVALAALTLAGYALAATPDTRAALYFAAGVCIAFIILAAMARLACWTAGRFSSGRGPRLTLALRALARSPGGAAQVLLSLGLGLTVLTCVGLIQGNLRAQVGLAMPETAPSYYFLDIQPSQVAAFEDILADQGVSRFERQPMLRARIMGINGVPAGQASIDPGVSWALRSDRGLSAMATPPDGTTVSSGTWWTEADHGKPLLSFTQDLADGFGLNLGDTLTINLLGREMTLTLANTRQVDWTTLAMNFSLVVPPGVVDGAPMTHIATVYADGPAEETVFKAVTTSFPNVTAVRIREALATVMRIISGIDGAVAAVAGVTLTAGLLVLAEALRASLRRRRYEAVVLKTLGATRGDVLAALLYEHLFLGIAAALTALVLGGLAGWVVVKQLMGLTTFRLLPAVAVGVPMAGLAATLILGLAGLRRLLRQRPWHTLRNE
jgi:putative ABC transport system permease protein